MGTNDLLLLGFFEYIHHAAITLRPITFHHAMHQENIDVVRLELAEVAVDVSLRLFGVARVALGHDDHLVAGQLAHRLRHFRVRTIGIRRIEEDKSAIIAGAQQTGQPTGPGLIGRTS
jgi:hypothetical protein